MRNTKTVDLDEKHLRFFDYDNQKYVTISLDSDNWRSWLSNAETFNIEFQTKGEKWYLDSHSAKKHTITVRPEKRKNSNNVYWYAYTRKRAHNKKLLKKYVGVSKNVTFEKLTEVRDVLAAQIFD